MRLLTAVMAALAFVTASGAGTPAAAAAALSIEPITWNVIGLDSNDVTSGPNQFPVGARICNTGDTDATGVSATFAWESANALIGLAGPDEIALGRLAGGACADAHFLTEVTRDPAAWLTTRRFRIDATADGVGMVSTPTPRQLLVEKLISQNRNDAISLDGPGDVFVGQTAVFDVTAKTATNGYEQIESFLPFPHGMFRLVSIERTYSAPPGATDDALYADACGWDHDPDSPTYRTCIGPAGFTGGKAGGDLTTRYTVLVVGTGTSTLTDLIYDFSGASYHYNADFGSPALTVTARDPIDLELVKSVDDAAPPLGGRVTFTLTLTNTSTTAATGVVVTDLLPDGLDLVSSDPSVGSHDAASGVWTVGSLDAGEVATLLVVVDTTGDAPVTNTAEVTAADQPDADSVPGNGDPAEDDQSSVTVDPGDPGPFPEESDGGADGADGGAAGDPGAEGADEVPVVGFDAAGSSRSAGALLVAGWLLLVAGHRRERRSSSAATEDV